MEASVLRQIDYFERAKRVEEVPLLEEQGKRDAEARREQYNEQQADRVSMTRAIRQTTGGSGKHVSFLQARVLSVGPAPFKQITHVICVVL